MRGAQWLLQPPAGRHLPGGSPIRIGHQRGNSSPVSTIWQQEEGWRRGRRRRRKPNNKGEK